MSENQVTQEGAAASAPINSRGDRALPLRLARLSEALCVGGLLLSVAAILVGLVLVVLLDSGVGVRVLFAGMAGLFVCSFVPTWVVGSYDAVRAGQAASASAANAAEFWATWGLLGFLAHVAARMKSQQEVQTSSKTQPDNNQMQRTAPTPTKERRR